MIIVQLDDGTGVVEMTVFNELFDANRHMFREDELLIATEQCTPRHLHRRRALCGRIGDGPGEGAQCLRQCTQHCARAGGLGHGALAHRAPRNTAPSRATPARPGLACWCGTATRVPRAEIHLGPNWRVEPDEALLGELRQWLGNDAVELMY
ncbi:hypothetical protein ACTMU2_24990 [Cupriavidus basilensis]